MKKLIAIIGFIFISLFLIACGSENNDSSVPYVDDIIHTEDHDVENETWPANYEAGMGGYTEDYYWCWDCQKAFDEEGNVIIPKLGIGEPVEYTEETE